MRASRNWVRRGLRFRGGGLDPHGDEAAHTGAAHEESGRRAAARDFRPAGAGTTRAVSSRAARLPGEIGRFDRPAIGGGAACFAAEI